MTRVLDLFEIEVPFRRPLRTATGLLEGRRSVLVRVAEDGYHGWGEAPAFPSGRFGTAEQAFADLVQPEGWKDDEPSIPIARAALQAARFDRDARSRGVAAHAALGSSGKPVVARHPIGLLDRDEARREAAWIDSHGIGAVKMKIAPGGDLAPLAELRTALPDLDIGVDANGGYRDPTDPIFLELEHQHVSFIEQPFPSGDLESHRALAEKCSIPLVIDEGVDSVEGVTALLAGGYSGQIAVKLNRYGIADFALILEEARRAGVGVRIGGTFDTVIGRRLILAAASLRGVAGAATGPPAAYLANPLGEYPRLATGMVAPDDVPGIGVDPDPDALESVIARHHQVER